MGRAKFSLGSFRGRKVAVVGMGKSNQALARYLIREGAEITCFDRKTSEEMGAAYEELSRFGVRWSLGSGYLSPLTDFKWIFLTPGMKKSQSAIVEARRRGAVISSEIGLFMDRCRCEIGAVTGSAGKTTTCTLAGMILRESLPGIPVYVGGNIGSVLIEQVDDIPEDARVVLELSSFQLELVTRSPHVAVVLNVRPNHLDIHDSYEEYVEAKKRIYRFQESGDWCFLNRDDGVTYGFAGECPGGVGYFTVSSREPGGTSATGGAIQRYPVAWADGSGLYVEPGPLVGSRDASPEWTQDESGLQRIAGRSDLLVPGEHNISNMLAAALLTTAMGATPSGISSAIKAFRGVEHRIEFTRELRGVKYFNDSKATTPDMTMALLEAIPGPLVLILGGYDKGLSFEALAEKVAKRGCPIITIGKTAEKIEAALGAAWREHSPEAGSPDVERAGSLDEAVRLAAAKAEEYTGLSALGSAGKERIQRKGTCTVALSPACASYDMFTDFEERGRLFKEAVMRLE